MAIAPTIKPARTLFTVNLTAEERAHLEAHRVALGLRSQADVIRHWLRPEAPPNVFDADGLIDVGAVNLLMAGRSGIAAKIAGDRTAPKTPPLGSAKIEPSGLSVQLGPKRPTGAFQKKSAK